MKTTSQYTASARRAAKRAEELFYRSDSDGAIQAGEKAWEEASDAATPSAVTWAHAASCWAAASRAEQASEKLRQRTTRDTLGEARKAREWARNTRIQARIAGEAQTASQAAQDALREAIDTISHWVSVMNTSIRHAEDGLRDDAERSAQRAEDAAWWVNTHMLQNQTVAMKNRLEATSQSVRHILFLGSLLEDDPTIQAYFLMARAYEAAAETIANRTDETAAAARTAAAAVIEAMPKHDGPLKAALAHAADTAHTAANGTEGFLADLRGTSTYDFSTIIEALDNGSLSEAKTGFEQAKIAVALHEPLQDSLDLLDDAIGNAEAAGALDLRDQIQAYKDKLCEDAEQA